MTKTGSVAGKVQDKHGVGQIGAEITVENTDLIGVTDMDASYCIPDVPAGQQRITARMVIGSQTKVVSVPPDGTVTVDFTLNPLKPG
jgi:hypothetical protein